MTIYKDKKQKNPDHNESISTYVNMQDFTTNVQDRFRFPQIFSVLLEWKIKKLGREKFFFRQRFSVEQWPKSDGAMRKQERVLLRRTNVNVRAHSQSKMGHMLNFDYTRGFETDITMIIATTTCYMRFCIPNYKWLYHE